MQNKQKVVQAAAIVLLALGSAVSGTAGVITGTLTSLPGTVSGTFANNSTALEETFTIGTQSLVTARTTSYATGGFQPNLELFTAAGTYVTSQAFSSALAVQDKTTGLALDSILSVNLAAGSYILLLTEFDYQLDASVTRLTPSSLFDAPIFPTFADQNGNTRSGAYALAVSASATPEPATLWLISPALFAALVLMRRRNALS